MCLLRVLLMFGETIRGLEDHQRTIGGTWENHGASLTQDDAIQELRMLSSVTIDCQVSMIIMNSGPELSVMSTISQNHVMSLSLLQGSGIALEVFPKCNFYYHMSERSLFEGVL